MDNTEAQLVHDREIAHLEALRAAKVGRRVAREAIRMADKGVDTARIPSTALGISVVSADSLSVTLAAQSDVQAMGEDGIRVDYKRTYDSDADVHDSVIHLT